MIGRASRYTDVDSVDWVPTLRLGYERVALVPMDFYDSNGCNGDEVDPLDVKSSQSIESSVYGTMSSESHQSNVMLQKLFIDSGDNNKTQRSGTTDARNRIQLIYSVKNRDTQTSVTTATSNRNQFIDSENIKETRRLVSTVTRNRTQFIYSSNDKETQTSSASDTINRNQLIDLANKKETQASVTTVTSSTQTDGTITGMIFYVVLS